MKRVLVKPFELFEFGGEWFVYHIKSRRHHRVAEADVSVLQAVCENVGNGLSEGELSEREKESLEEKCELSEREKELSGEAFELSNQEKEILRKYQLLSIDPLDYEEETDKLVANIKRIRQKNYPVTLELMVSQSCNMRCEYCYGSGGNYHESGLMDFETAKRGLDWFRKFFPADRGVKPQIAFFGGEPMMNFSVIKQSADYARSLFKDEGVAFGMATNMTLITDEQMDYFSGLDDFQLLVSVDGPENIHNKQRPLTDGRNSYEVTAERIAKAISKGITCTGRATVYADTDRTLVAEEMKKLGLTNWQLSIVSGCAVDGITRNDSSIVYERWLKEWPQKGTALVGAIRERNLENAKELLSDVDFMNTFIRGISDNNCSSDVMGCIAGRGQYALSASGRLYPCHRFVGMDEFCYGEISDFPLGAGWDEFKSERLEKNKECRKCFLRYFCGGECYYQCYTDGPDKSIYGMSDLFCEYNRMRMKLLVYFFNALSPEDKRWFIRAMNGR